MTDADFLASIDTARDDMTPRLVYADWLEERGETLRADAWRWLAEDRNPFTRPGQVWWHWYPYMLGNDVWRFMYGRRHRHDWINALLDAADAYCEWRRS